MGPSRFVSLRQDAGGSVVAISDARTDRVVEVVYRIKAPLAPSLSLDPDRRHVWITTSEGPSCTSDIAGCGPRAHSCSSDVMRLDLATRKIDVVLRGNDNELIDDAVPSPDGSRIAFSMSGCANGYFNNWLQVMDLRTRHQFSIGKQAAPCHLLTDQQWSADGRHLVAVYGASFDAHSPDDGYGMCEQPHTSQLVLVDAGRPQPGFQGRVVRNDPGCEPNAVTTTSHGYAAIEVCGPQPGITGPIRLIRYNARLAALGRTPLGRCDGGASIAADTNGDLITSTYQFCAEARGTEPITKVIIDTDGTLHTIAELSGGNLMVDNLGW